MNKIAFFQSAHFLLFLFLIHINILQAQEPKLSVAELTVYECQKEITDYSIDQMNKINTVLRRWERVFGENEPILRVKILSDIHKRNYTDDSSKIYIDNYITKYIDRYYASQEEDAEKIYIQEKGWFDHVPLNGLFDAWTKVTALKLLPFQEEGSSEYIFCTLFSDDIDGFYDLMYSKKYKQNKVRKTFYKSEISSVSILSITAGSWIPGDQLNRYFNPSPFVGIKAGYTIYENVRIDFGTNVTILSNSETFQMKDDSIMDTKGDFILSIGGLFTREFNFFGDYYFDVNAGVGVSLLNTDKGYYSYDAEYDTESYVSYYITSGDYSAGFTFRRMLDARSSFGFQVMYHLTPYKNNRKMLSENIGMNSFTVSFLFKF